MSAFFSWQHAVRASKLESTTKLVCYTIWSHMASDGTGAFPSYNLIAEESGLSRRAVILHVGKAEKAGFLAVDGRDRQNGSHSSNLYRATMPGEPDSPRGELGAPGDGAPDAPLLSDHLSNKPEQTPLGSPTKEPNHGNKRGQRLEAYLASIAEAEWERYRLGEIPIRFYEHGLERGWTDGYIRETFAAFRDYWLAESGAKAVKRDWLAAWRNWCRNEVKFSRGRSPAPSKSAAVADAVLAALMGDEGVASGAPETVAGAIEAGEGGADGGWDHLGHSQLQQ